MPPHNTISEKIEEFEKVFVKDNLWKSDSEDTAYVDIERIKAFLRSALESQLEGVRREIEGKRKINCGCPPFESKHDGACDDKDHTELNNVLDDLLAVIKGQPEDEGYKGIDGYR